MKKQSRVDEQKLTAGTKAAPKNQNDLFKQEKNAPNNPSPGNMGAKANAGGQAERPEREEEQAKTGRRQRPDKAKKVELNVTSLIKARRRECITQALSDERDSKMIYSKPNDKLRIILYDHCHSKCSIWSPLPRNPYLFLDCFNINRYSNGKMKRVSILVAIRVTNDGFRNFIQIREAVGEGKAMWMTFFRSIYLPKLKGIKLVISYSFPGLKEFLSDFSPRVRWQRCLEDWYRNALALCPKQKRRALSKKLKTIHKEDDRFFARDRAFQITNRLQFLNGEKIINFIDLSVKDTLAYMDFPREHWTPLSTNIVTLYIRQEIRQCERLIASYPEGKSTQVLLLKRLCAINSGRRIGGWPNP